MRYPYLPIFLVFLSVIKTAQAAAPSYDSYKAWLVSCDNTLTCEAKGFLNDESTIAGNTQINGRVDLRFIRNAGPDGRTEARLSAGFPFGLTDLKVDAKPLVLAPSAWQLKTQDGNTVLSTRQPAAIAALLTQLRDGTMLHVRDDGVPLSGLKAALLRMDDKQGRIDGVTALIRQGPKPASTVPPAPLTPSIPPAHATPSLPLHEQTHLLELTRTTQAELIKKYDCENLDKEQDDLLLTGAYTLDHNNALVLIGCAMGAYQGTSLAFVVSRTGKGQARPASLPRPVLSKEDSRQNDNTLTGPDLDKATGTLTEFAKGRGLSDCGTSSSWRWDGHSFALTAMTFQSACGGSLPSDWPTLYRSTKQKSP